MYLSIDIETTGLNPDTCQVLEIAAVLDVRKLSVMKCPYFRSYVVHDTIVGEPYALAMNQKLLYEIADGEGINPACVIGMFDNWLDEHGIRANNKATMLGKNVGSFDLQFLKRLPDWPGRLFNHRCCDIGSLYSTENGMVSQTELEERLGVDMPGEAHTALHDTRVALACARTKWGVLV
jgi:oligoribonuclease (3'-5' exoribonuclease)